MFAENSKILITLLASLSWSFFFFFPHLLFPFHLEMANDVRLGLRSMVRIYDKHTDDRFLVGNACTDESLLVSSSSLPPLELPVVLPSVLLEMPVLTVEVSLVASSPFSRVPLQRHWHAHQPALILYCILLLVLRNVSLHSLIVLFIFNVMKTVPCAPLTHSLCRWVTSWWTKVGKDFKAWISQHDVPFHIE